MGTAGSRVERLARICKNAFSCDVAGAMQSRAGSNGDLRVVDV